MVLRKNKWILSVVLNLLVCTTGLAQETGKQGKMNPRKTVKCDSEVFRNSEFECFIQNNGTFGNNSSTGGPGFFYPYWQRTLSILWTAGLWFLGKQDGEIRSAVSFYGSEFQPGSILSPGVPDDPFLNKYKIYKYYEGEAVDSVAISQGCPEEVLGERMLFSVYNDVNDHSGLLDTAPLGIEVQHTVFGFSRFGALGHTMFQRYRIINKSDSDIEDAYIAMFLDPDLGYADDDYVGCDQDFGIAYVYNGDGYDENYGVQVPSLGCDFLQGPIIDSIGETAVLPDGTEIPDSRILEMTSFFVILDYIHFTGSPDRFTVENAYNLCSGLTSDGSYWLDPTKDDTPTTFPFSGDPVKETGWLLSSVTPPTDVIMGSASGPFDLAVGEYQDIYVGIVVGQGVNNLNSISLMKYYDRAVQFAYDMNFVLPSNPKYPKVTVAELDEELVLMWDDRSITFNELGYLFEGFNIWQGESMDGPWNRIATFDCINGTTVIMDLQYNSNTESFIEQAVQFGEDTGLKFKFHVTKDHIQSGPNSWNPVPLINGKPYYFAVTPYAYNSNGVPRCLEPEQWGVMAMPHRPVLDTEFNSDVGDTLVVEHTVGFSQGCVSVEVVDPSAIIGQDYTIIFFEEEDSTSVHFGKIGWRLTTSRTGYILLDNQFDQSGKNETVPVHGFQVSVSSPNTGIQAFVQVANPTYPEPLPANQLDTAGESYGGNNVWLSLSCPDDENHNGRYFWSYDSAYIGDLSASHDYEIRWKDGVTDYSWGEWGFEDDNFDKVPFEIWDIGFATPYDDSDDERMIPIMGSAGTTTVWDVPSGNMTENNWGYACSDRIYFIYPDPGYTYDDFHAAAEASDFVSADNMWGVINDRWFPFQNLVIVNYSHKYTGPAPSAGSIDRILTNKPNSPADVFSFSTAGYRLTRSEDVAKKRLKDINVFPNPYFGQNSAESDFYTQFVTFNNLSEKCTIRIFSLSGSLVKTIEHTDGSPFERWYLKNESDRPVASGMYIVHVQTMYGDRILKLAVINRTVIIKDLY